MEFAPRKGMASFILGYKALFVSIIIENIFDVFRLQTDHFLRHGADTSETKSNRTLV